MVFIRYIVVKSWRPLTKENPLYLLTYRATIQFKKSQFLLFANDFKLSLYITSINDCLTLKNEFNLLVNCCNNCGRSFNISKCYSISFHRLRNPIKFEYIINNNMLNKYHQYNIWVLFLRTISISINTFNIL